jgi:hypothetical protein
MSKTLSKTHRVGFSSEVVQHQRLGFEHRPEHVRLGLGGIGMVRALDRRRSARKSAKCAGAAIRRSRRMRRRIATAR